MTPRATGRLGRAALFAAGAIAALGAGASTLSADSNWTIEIEVAGTYASGIFAQGGAEIVRYDATTKRVFAVNAKDASVDVLDASDPTAPTKVASISVKATLEGDDGFEGTVAGANSVAVHGGVLAVAVEAAPKTDLGWVAFYATDDLRLLGWAQAGALPDMVTFTHSGRYALVANEGEPNSYGQADSVDPEGSVTVVEMNGNFRRLSAVTVGFRAFDGQEDELRAAGVRIFGPGASASEDFEPESIAVSHDDLTAFVTLQENNAVAVLDLQRHRFTRILPLGFKDHSAAGNAFDGSDRDGPGNAGRLRIANWPVRGLYMPDGISTFRANGRDWLVTANEGDSRQDWLPEEARVRDLALDATAFPNGTDLKNDDFIGRLTVTTTLGDADGDGDFDALYSFGARSFSIWSEDGDLVFDSGDHFETHIADVNPTFFNSDHEVNNFDNRSDNKGPEPEGVAIGEIRGRTFAFVGLERVGGIMVYDISDPREVKFVQYLNNRDFTGDPEGGTAGDLGPEGIDFVPERDSPTGRPMIVVGNEVSGTTTIYDIRIVK